MKSDKKIKIMISVLIIISIIIASILWIKNSNWDFKKIKNIFSSVEELRNYINTFGKWAPPVFFLIQLGQVIISPIPGNITSMVGGMIFGIGKGFILSSLAIILGSIIAFGLARVWGRKLVIKLIGEELVNKYIDKLSVKYAFTLFIFFLLPFFPDDALCLIAGLTPIPFSVFLIFLFVARTPGIFVSTLVGAGIITMSWTELLILGSICAICIYIIFKYRSNIEYFLNKKIKGN